MSSCHKTHEEQLTEAIDSFSATYFNWQFHRAVAFSTPESRPWLSYMASQVSQKDIDALRAMPQSAAWEIGHISYADGDSAAQVEVKVNHFLAMDTIGQQGTLTDRATFVVPAVYRQGQWKVNLSAPLRAEKD